MLWQEDVEGEHDENVLDKKEVFEPRISDELCSLPDQRREKGDDHDGEGNIDVHQYLRPRLKKPCRISDNQNEQQNRRCNRALNQGFVGVDFVLA